MVGVAAGMAMRGIRPFCYSMVPFVLFRPLDQVRCDICSMRLPVTLVGVGGGLTYGLEGMTHHAIEDFAVTRALPNLVTVSPGDPIECVALLKEIVTIDGPCYLRLGANNDANIHHGTPDIRLGKLACLSHQGTCAIITTGTMLSCCLEAVRELAAQGVDCRLYSAHTIKPLDEAGIAAIAESCAAIVSVEEHSVVNGLGTAVAETLFQTGYRGLYRKIGLPDAYADRLGHRKWLLEEYGLAPSNIADVVLSMHKSSCS